MFLDIERLGGAGHVRVDKRLEGGNIDKLVDGVIGHSGNPESRRVVIPLRNNLLSLARAVPPVNRDESSTVAVAWGR